MRNSTVFWGMAIMAGALVILSCASAQPGAQDIADYQNLIQRADRLVKLNQSYEEAIKLKDEQIATLKAQLADATALISSQGDVQKKILEITAQRDTLAQQSRDLRAMVTNYQMIDAQANQRVKDAIDQLKLAFKDEIKQGSVIVREYRGIMMVEMTSSVTFAANSSTLKPEFEKMLIKLALIFQILPEKIVRVEGHTATFDNDNEKISWELGAARAIKVTRFLHTAGGIDPERMVVVSYGKFWPEAPNDVEANRVKNRNVTFALIDRNFYLLNELRQISMR